MRRSSLSLVAVLFLLTACADLLDPAAAVVYNRKLTVDEVQAGLDRFTQTSEYERLSAQGDAKAIRRQFEQGFLSQLVRRAVLEPKAGDLGVEVTTEEVAERLEEIKNDFPSEAAFAEALKEQGLDEEQLDRLVRDSLLEEELRTKVTEEATPSEQELRVFYEDRVDDYRESRAQHILVENESLARAIRDQILAEPKKKQDDVFARLARMHSTDKSNAKDGGDLGYSSPGDFVAPFEDALNELEIGDVSKPVKTEFGWHVIRLIDRRTQPFEEVEQQLREEQVAQIEERVWSEWLRQAYEDAEVKINPRYGELDIESGQVVDARAEDIPGAEVPSPTPTVVPTG